MLRRNGELCEHSVPGFNGKLTSAEFDAYRAALGFVSVEFEQLQQIKEQLSKVANHPTAFSDQANPSIEIISTPAYQDAQWQSRACLLKLSCSQIDLGERSVDGEKEFAIIQRFRPDSPYAQANGSADVVLTGNSPTVLVQDFVENTDHTLHFMASNVVARAQRMIWENSVAQDSSRVVRAISERCSGILSPTQVETVCQTQSSKRGLGNQV